MLLRRRKTTRRARRLVPKRGESSLKRHSPSAHRTQSKVLSAYRADASAETAKAERERADAQAASVGSVGRDEEEGRFSAFAPHHVTPPWHRATVGMALGASRRLRRTT